VLGLVKAQSIMHIVFQLYDVIRFVSIAVMNMLLELVLKFQAPAPAPGI